MADHLIPSLPAEKKAFIIVVGNEKGGAGKTTLSMHLITSLLALGFEVGSVDVDSRQLSLSRYLENRRRTIIDKGVNLFYPNHAVVRLSPFNVIDEAENDEAQRFYSAISKACLRDDFVIIDTPGSHSNLSRIAHSYADMVITPVNDSFVDLDVIAHVERGSLNVTKPGVYSEMVWEQKIKRAKRDGGEVDWIVVRNRLSSIDAKNKRNVQKVLSKLEGRLGLRQAKGFGERVIYREMFLHGLTLLDVTEKGANVQVSMSHLAAKQELREFLQELRIPEVTERLKSPQAYKTPQEKKAPASNNIAPKKPVEQPISEATVQAQPTQEASQEQVKQPDVIESVKASGAEVAEKAAVETSVQSRPMELEELSS